MGCEMCRPPLPITDDQRSRIEAILNFWFEEGWNRNSYPGDKAIDRWFAAPKNVEQFKGYLDKYLQGEYTGWPYDRDGNLAAIILLSQLTKTLLGNTKQAYEAYEKALKLSLKTIDNQEIMSQYTVYEKAWIIYPLMQQESGKYTRKSINIYHLLNYETENKQSNLY